MKHTNNYTGNYRNRLSLKDNVFRRPHGATAAVGHGGPGAVSLAHSLLHTRLLRRRHRLRHH